MKRLALAFAAIMIVFGAGAATFAALRLYKAQNEPAASSDSRPTPELRASIVVEGLAHPWDVDFLPDRTLLFTERSGEISKLVDGEKISIELPDDINPGGEGGMMGLAVDPDFAVTRFIFACFNTTAGDIRVVRWMADQTVESLTNRQDIVSGIPAADSGRHSGCQIAFGPDDNLWVATGDAADDTTPQDPASLGGKILRVDRDGKAAADNVDSVEKRVYSFGHRNSQALAFYAAKRDGSFGVSVEHGPDRDDEINQLKPGNFGWAPGPGYDESVPMTDTERFSGATQSIWSSGSRTIAPSGAAFVRGSSWGRLSDWLAVSVLKDKQLLLLNISNGSVNGTRTFFENTYGRLRAATLGPDSELYLSTDNGSNDAIIKVTPQP